MKIAIGITTYNRPEQLKRLLNDILSSSSGYTFHIHILDDGSNPLYDYTSFIESETWTKFVQKHHASIEFMPHHGKQMYWKLITHLYEYFRDVEFDYFIQLPDDVMLHKDFFPRAVESFASIHDKDKIALNLLFDGRIEQKNWCSQPSMEFDNIYKTGWLDMLFICQRQFFEILDYKIHEVKQNWNQKFVSSGVGKQISKRMQEKNKSIYLIKDIIVYHGSHESVMHKELRILKPLVSKPRIICGMASFQDRKTNVVKSAMSIVDQVDELHIYLNNYKVIPSGLVHKKIKCYLSSQHAGDLGDAGKFFRLQYSVGYFFSIDDDLIYPKGYVNIMIAKIEQYNRKCIITCHGRNLNPTPINNYYKNSTPKIYRCLGNVDNDIILQVGGTGVMAFHTELLKPTYTWFKLPNMADIWMAKYSQENNIPIICIAHYAGWIQQQNVKFDSQISVKLKNNNAHICNLINNINWKTISMETKTVIVIPYIHKENEFEALRYALRSIDKNAKFDHQVIIIGDCPDWVNKDEVRHIPQERDPKAPYTNCFDANRKMNTILLDPTIGENIVVTYDDIYFLKETSLEDLEKLVCCVKKLDNYNPTSIHSQLLVNTFDAIKSKRRPRPIIGDEPQIFNCETHLPRFIKKSKMTEVYKTFLPIKNRLLIYSLYFNTWFKGCVELSRKDGIKAGFYGTNDEYSFLFDDKKKIQKLLNGKMFLNHDDKGLSPILREVIEETFSETCKYEVKIHYASDPNAIRQAGDLDIPPAAAGELTQSGENGNTEIPKKN